MKVGITIPAYELASGRARNFEDMAGDVVAAERLGYDSAWVMDHFFFQRGSRRVLGGPEPLAFLSHVAARTRRIELGTLVLCAPFRPAAQLAREARTLQAATGGRFILGMGAGWHQPEFDAFGFPFDHLVSRFEEYLEVLTRLLREDDLFGDPTPPPWVAAGGPRMIRLTGRLAGGWNGAWYGADTTLFRERLAAVESALQAAGRDRSELTASAGLFVLPGAVEAPSAIAGEPARVAEAIRGYREAGCDHAILNFSTTPFGLGEQGGPALLAPLLDRLR
jgi:alkanesulfonate monooxygenase SsuD/methylene tetrahydromethanopterin reductase-like flavin-dependent oxidoreductase (luciferase family)